MFTASSSASTAARPVAMRLPSPRCCRRPEGRAHRPTCLHAAPLIHEDVLILVEAELARAGPKGRAIVVTDRSPAHALRTIAEREGAELIVVGSSRRGGVDRILAGDDAAATLHWAPYAVAGAPPVER